MTEIFHKETTDRSTALLVDAPALNADHLSTRLERNHEMLTVSTASSAQEALRSLAAFSIDCVVSGYSLRDTTGLDLLREVRSEYPELPFVLCPADGSERLASEAIRVGVTDYVPRDSEAFSDTLGERIERAIDTTRVETESRRRNSPLATFGGGCGDVIYLLDENGRIIHWTDAARKVTGYSNEEMTSIRPTHLFAGDGVARIATAIDRARTEGRANAEAELVAKDGTTIPHQFTGIELTGAADDRMGVVGIGRNPIENSRREETRGDRKRTLDRLRRSAHQVLAHETVDELAARVTDAAHDALDSHGCAIYLLDEETGTLRPVEYTSELSGFVADYPRVAEGQLSWEAYAVNETRVYDDVQTLETVEDLGIPARSALIVPLGDHGVFVAGDSSPGAFDDRDVAVAELLAAIAVQALDRIDLEDRLRDRAAVLDERTERVTRYERITEVYRNIDRVLVEAETRAELERDVCDRLVAVDSFEFAWIGEPAVDGPLDVRSWAGTDDSYLEQVSGDSGGGLPAEAVVKTGEVAVVSDIFDERKSAAWRREAAKRGYRSVISVPLTYREAVYGVLEVYADRGAVFDEDMRAIMGELGETIGHAFNALDRKDALLSERMTRLEFEVRDERDFYVRLSEQLDRPFEIEAVVPQPDGSYHYFGTVDDPSPDRFLEFADESSEVSDVTHIGTRNGENTHVFKYTTTGVNTVTTLADYGAIPRKITDTVDGVRIVADIPQETDVGSFARTFSDHYPDSELVAQRASSRDVNTEGELQEAVVDRLTDRQWEALHLAYLSGFFEWPREATGEDVAEALDIVPSTFHQHLRASQRKLLDATFGESE